MRGSTSVGSNANPLSKTAMMQLQEQMPNTPSRRLSRIVRLPRWTSNCDSEAVRRSPADHRSSLQSGPEQKLTAGPPRNCILPSRKTSEVQRGLLQTVEQSPIARTVNVPYHRSTPDDGPGLTMTNTRTVVEATPDNGIPSR